MAVSALGWEFLDQQGYPILPGGAGLEQVAKIVEPKDLHLPAVEVLCDVDNPLCGEHGAAKVYGPQKGATPQMAEQLEKGFVHLAALVQNQLQCDINNVPGAGAAGGLAAGAIAFMNAKLVSGIETIMAYSNLGDELRSADWIITGEGCFDHQSLCGKVVSGVAKIASQSNTRLAVLAGRIAVPQTEFGKLAISTAVSCRTNDMPLDYALKNCRTLLRSAARKFAAQHLTRQLHLGSPPGFLPLKLKTKYPHTF